MSISLSDLKNQVRGRTDFGGFNESQLVNFINEGYLRLYDLLTNTYQGFNQKSFDFTIASNQDGYDIPDSISVYKLNGIDWNPGSGNPQSVGTFQWAERNQYNWATAIVAIQPYVVFAPMVYCYMGDRIIFRPFNQAGGTYRCYYVPDLDLLVNDTDTIQKNMDKWYNYIVVDASIRLLDSAQADSTVLQNELMKLEATVKSFMQNRNQDAPKRVADTRGFGFDVPSTYITYK